MTRENVWKVWKLSNPKFLTEGASFSCEELKKIFDFAFEQGRNEVKGGIAPTNPWKYNKPRRNYDMG